MIGFGPEESRRAGDYRGWMGGSAGMGLLANPLNAEDWTRQYELWRPDLREIDVGLFEDMIERVFRKIYNQYLLTDAGSSRLVLTIPSLMPHPLLSAILSTLFSRWRFPSITLLPSATMSAAAAGLRSALVVDLGWAETTVTGIYEYREITTKRSTRAMKGILQETGRLLSRLTSSNEVDEATTNDITMGFEYCEELVCRLAWCKPNPGHDGTVRADRTISIPSPANPEQAYIDVPFSVLAEPSETTFFAPGIPDNGLDDEEKTIPLLVYNTLLALSPDARGTCMSRIVFVGGGARIPGLRQRILHEVSLLIDQHGWSPIRGTAVERQRQRLDELRLLSQSSKGSTEEVQLSAANKAEPATTIKKPDSAQEGSEVDFVEQKLRREKKDSPIPVQGVLREVETLGPWAGASLVTSLKIRGMVEIERERFMQHGLAGGTRETEHPVQDRRFGLKAGDRSSWTLTNWA